VVSRVDAREVGAVEGIEGFGDQLQRHTLVQAYVTRDAWIEAEEIRPRKRIAVKSRRAIRKAVAVVIQIRPDFRRVRTARFACEDAAEAPARQQRPPDVIV